MTSISDSNAYAHPEKTSASQVRWKQGRWQKQKILQNRLTTFSPA